MQENHVYLFPSGEIPNLGKNLLSVHHHMCAVKARMCWKLWNDGFPFLRVLDHNPIDSKQYFIDFEKPINQLKKGDKHKITKPALAVFLIDLLRLKKMKLRGRYNIHVEDYNFSFENRIFEGKRLLLVPNLMDIEKHESEIIDILSLAKLAWGCSSAINRDRRTIETMLKFLMPNFPLHKSRIDFAKQSLFIDTEDNRMYLKRPERGKNKLLRLKANHKGFWFYSEGNDEINLDEMIEIKVLPNSTSGGNFTTSGLIWYHWALVFQKQPKSWHRGRVNPISKNLIGTIAAEFKHAQEKCYKYELINIDKKSKSFTLRIERKDGNGNAFDLWDDCIRDKDMSIAINSKSNVFEWTEKDIFHLHKTHEKDPFLVSVRFKKSINIPKSGYLKQASIPQRALMFRKQKLVLSAIEKRSIINLKDFKSTFFDVFPDAKGFNKKNLVCIQGPPGTGKTYTVIEIIRSILKENPCARFLVCSKEHLALDHLSEGIRESLDQRFDVVRINKSKDFEENILSKVSPEYLSKKVIQSLSNSRDILREEGRLSTLIDDLSLRAASVICTTTLDSTIEKLQQSEITFDYCIIEEAGKSYPSELIGPMSISRHNILVGDHLQLPPFELIKIEEKIKSCLTDGINKWPKKSYSEDLDVQLINLVIDYKDRDNPDLDSSIKSIKSWLQPFQTLHQISHGYILSTQWRMFNTLSDIIGEIFYKDKFLVRKENKIDNNNLPGIFGRHSNRLLFIDIPNAKENHHNKSYCNEIEAKYAAENLSLLLDGKFDTVAITPYSGQVEAICNNLPKKYHKYVKTVDAFQGKEADFIIISFVRNNNRTGSSRRWGFIRDPRRLNVALSRSREGLIVISSKKHIRETDWKEDEGQLDDFISIIEEKGKIISGD